MLRMFIGRSNEGFPMRFMLIFLFCFGLTSLSFADVNGDRKIRFSGAISENTPTRLSVKEIESHFTLYEGRHYNPWDKVTRLYKGVLLHEFATKFAQPNTRKITMKAIDDYQISFTPELWNTFRILIVTQEEGRYLSVDKKGPMRIIFLDYDAKDKAFESNLAQWMWMINRIKFE